MRSITKVYEQVSEGKVSLRQFREWVEAQKIEPSTERIDHGRLHPIDTVRVWANAYGNSQGDDRFKGHGMASVLLSEYLKLRETMENKE